MMEGFRRIWKTTLMRAALFLAKHRRLTRLVVWLTRLVNGPIR